MLACPDLLLCEARGVIKTASIGTDFGLLAITLLLVSGRRSTEPVNGTSVFNALPAAYGPHFASHFLDSSRRKEWQSKQRRT